MLSGLIEGKSLGEAAKGAFYNTLDPENVAKAFMMSAITSAIMVGSGMVKVGNGAGKTAQNSQSTQGTKQLKQDEFSKCLNKGESNNTVYKGIDKAGNEVYTGITKQDLSASLAQHNRAGKGFDDLIPKYSNLTRNQARSIETYLIRTDGTSQVNQILSVSTKHRFFEQAMEWAAQFLGKL